MLFYLSIRSRIIRAAGFHFVVRKIYDVISESVLLLSFPIEYEYLFQDLEVEYVF